MRMRRSGWLVVVASATLLDPAASALPADAHASEAGPDAETPRAAAPALVPALDQGSRLPVEVPWSVVRVMGADSKAGRPASRCATRRSWNLDPVGLTGSSTSRRQSCSASGSKKTTTRGSSVPVRTIGAPVASSARRDSLSTSAVLGS